MLALAGSVPLEETRQSRPEFQLDSPLSVEMKSEREVGEVGDYRTVVELEAD